MRIILVGGGTGGPVKPLLSVAEEIRKNHPKARFLFVGTQTGPERDMVRHAGLDFLAIPAGKLRRYFSWANFLAPFQVAAGFLKSFSVLRSFRPDCVLGAGGFVQVPLVWAAWIMRVPVVIHQQDVVPGLANKLSQWFATAITVTFEDSIRDFNSSFGLVLGKGAKRKVIWTGNPATEAYLDCTREEGLKKFGLSHELPVLLVTGGGTGSEALNGLLYQALPELTRFIQVIHATGKGKSRMPAQEHYHPYEFISEMGYAYAAADIVLCRAGLSTITELSLLGKVSIVVPLPNTHQEHNAFLLAKEQAALVNSQNLLDAAMLAKGIRRLLLDAEMQRTLKTNIRRVLPSNASQKIATIVVKLAETSTL